MARENATIAAREAFLPRAKDLHHRAVVIDTHCDTTQRLLDGQWDISLRHCDGHVDIPRLRDGGVAAMFFAVWAKGPLPPGEGAPLARRQIRRIHEIVAQHPHDLVLARTADEVQRAKAQGRIAILIAIEGGYLIDDSLDVLREFAREGATYLTLTHAFHTTWADSSGVHEDLPSLHGGLTHRGREVVRELNRLGMIVDVSHVSDATFHDVIETSKAPVVATHSSCRALSPHRRNLSDDMMRAIARTGGVVQINFSAGFIDPDYPEVDEATRERWYADGRGHGEPLTRHVTPLSILVNHFDHAIGVVGADHVGIGTDFDGIPQLPEDMEDCSKLPNLTAALLARGHSEPDLQNVLGGNVLRVMRDCAVVADAIPKGGQ